MNEKGNGLRVSNVDRDWIPNEVDLQAGNGGWQKRITRDINQLSWLDEYDFDKKKRKKSSRELPAGD